MTTPATITLDRRYYNALEALALAVEPFALHAVEFNGSRVVPELDYQELMAARADYLKAIKYAPRPQLPLFESEAA